jgi:hypothetical protein
MLRRISMYRYREGLSAKGGLVPCLRKVVNVCSDTYFHVPIEKGLSAKGGVGT